MANYSAFSYKPGKTFVHRLPSQLKILFIPIFNIIIFSLDWHVAAAFILIQFILFCFLKFTLKEQLTDLTPVIWYAIFMYLIGFCSGIYIGLTSGSHFANGFFETMQEIKPTDLLSSILQAVKTTFNDEKTLNFVVKFCACNQSASLMFKTSTSLELKQGIESIEIKIRKFLSFKWKTKNDSEIEPKFSVVISMFINFLPAVFKIWNQLKKSWKARNGKTSLRMYLVLLPVLFSVGLKYAANSAKAVCIRKGKI